MKRLRLGIFLTLSILIVTAGLAVAASQRHSSPQGTQTRVTFTMGNSLWMMNADGTGSHVFASAKTPYVYSWYSWSPDGGYLLVVKNVPGASASELLLYSATGKRLRILVRRVPWSGFYPSWASNLDRVAFVAGSCSQPDLKASSCAQPSDSAVYSVDVHGQRRFIGSYSRAGGGCGGGVADPAGDLYRIETDFGVGMPPLQWTAGSPFSPPGAMASVTQPVQRQAVSPSDAVVELGGVTAATIQRCTNAGCTSHVVLRDPSSGRSQQTIGQGEMPIWSPDGKFLYFVRRIAGKTLMLRDSANIPMSSQIYTSEIWRVDADGSHVTRILSEPAYGFGPLSVSSDGRTIFFSSVGTDSRLWQHRLSGNRFDERLLKKYGPEVKLQRVDVGTGTVVTLVTNAGRPAVQPAGA
jgi:WD40-like Beta Propeller Repeat